MTVRFIAPPQRLGAGTLLERRTAAAGRPDGRTHARCGRAAVMVRVSAASGLRTDACPRAGRHFHPYPVTRASEALISVQLGAILVDWGPRQRTPSEFRGRTERGESGRVATYSSLGLPLELSLRLCVPASPRALCALTSPGVNILASGMLFSGQRVSELRCERQVAYVLRRLEARSAALS